MSTEWYIQSFSSGEEQSVPVKKVLTLLSEYKTLKSDDHIDIALPDGDAAIYMNFMSDEVSHMMIARPIKSKFLDRLIYDIMRSANYILCAPGGSFPIVLSPETSDHLPEGMTGSLGEPRIAENAESFSQLLKEMYGQQC